MGAVASGRVNAGIPVAGRGPPATGALNAAFAAAAASLQDTFEFVQEGVNHNPAQSLPPLNVVSSDGWELQLYYRWVPTARLVNPALLWLQYHHTAACTSSRPGPHKAVSDSLPPLPCPSPPRPAHRGARGDMKLKPGWVTSKGGAVLNFLVNSAFEGHPADQVGGAAGRGCRAEGPRFAGGARTYILQAGA